MPADWMYETAARWDGELAAVESVVADRATSVWLVAEPGPAGADAVRTAVTGLAVRALRPELLVANRVLPDHGQDSWPAGLAAQQRKALEEWQGTYDVHPLPHLGRDPRGADDLGSLLPPGVNPAPDRSSGPWRTASPRTECSCGTSRCPARYARNSSSYGAATNSS